jgi:hypothetical protein
VSIKSAGGGRGGGGTTIRERRVSFPFLADAAGAIGDLVVVG